MITYLIQRQLQIYKLEQFIIANIEIIKSLNTAKNMQINKSNLKLEVYQKLKLWDRKRAQVLKYHKKATEQILSCVVKKIQDSKDFVNSLQTMLQQRVNQLKAYCLQSVMDSQLIVERNKNQSYANHYQLLKSILTIQAESSNKASAKLSQLSAILNDLKNRNNQDPQSNQIDHKDQNTLLPAKSNIKYLLNCQLPQIVQQVIKNCEKTSKIYNQKNDQDLYLAISQFVRCTHKQTNKHRQIGRQLVKYVYSSIKKQIQVQNKIRACLVKWSEIDGPIDDVFIEQLTKKQPSTFVKQFFEIDEMTDVSYQQENAQRFITNFKIQQFNQHFKLKLVDLDGFYNSKIETRIVVTIDCFIHLIRPSAFQPDFSFKLNSYLEVKKNKKCGLIFIQSKKKFYFKKEKEFQFQLQLNNEQDLHNLRTIIQKVSDSKVL